MKMAMMTTKMTATVGMGSRCKPMQGIGDPGGDAGGDAGVVTRRELAQGSAKA